MSSPPLVWFLLLDSATGESYKKTTADYVSLAPGYVVAQFRDAVMEKFDKQKSSVLTGFASSQLAVYKNKAAFVDGKEEPLDPTKTLGLLGSNVDMLVVAVPSSRSSSRITSESSFLGKEPNSRRKQRWIKLNEILKGNAKKSKTDDSTAYS